MEDEICLYGKFGYCKFKEECKRQHLSTECEDLDNCKSIKICKKRHPKSCKKHVFGKCRFGESCAYKHHKPAENKDHEELKDKMAVLEKVMHAMTRKVLSLESEVEKLKKKNILNIEDELKEIEYNKVTKELTKEKVQQSMKTKDAIEVHGASVRVDDQKNISCEQDNPKDSKEKKSIVKN